MPFGDSVPVAGSTPAQFKWSAFPYAIANTGLMYSTGAGPGAGVATSSMEAPSTANADKTVTDDSSTTSRTVRQDARTLSIPANSHCYIIGTVDATADGQTDGTGMRLYAGEIVGATTSHANGVQTAKRPELDLNEECPFVQIYFKNDTGSALVIGTATLATSGKAVMNGIAHIPAD